MVHGQPSSSVIIYHDGKPLLLADIGAGVLKPCMEKLDHRKCFIDFASSMPYFHMYLFFIFDVFVYPFAFFRIAEPTGGYGDKGITRLNIQLV